MCREAITGLRFLFGHYLHVILAYIRNTRVARWASTRRLEHWMFYGLSIMVIIFIVLLSVLWTQSINNQLYGYVLKASDAGSEGYNQNFSLALKDFAFTIKEYSNVSLTLFGFTFIGEIFIIFRRSNSIEERLRRYFIIITTITSVFFIISFVSLFSLSALLYPYTTIEAGGIKSLLTIGLGLLILGTAMLTEIIIYTILFHVIPRQNRIDEDDIMFNGS